MLENKLKELRQAAGLSQRALAEKLSVSQQTVGKWETGGATPNPETLASIADVFGVTVDCLLGREPSPEDTLKFALFGDTDVDDEVLEEVRRFAQFAKQRREQPE